MANKVTLGSGKEYGLSYGNFRGVDRHGNGSDISKNRLAYAENMYRDYSGADTGVIESIPGFRKLYSFGMQINGIYYWKCTGGNEYFIVHAGAYLYKFDLEDKDLLEELSYIGKLANRKSCGVAVKDHFYILDGEAIHKVSENGHFSTVTKDSSDVYVPTRYVNGTELEQRNLLTDRFIEEYLVSDPKQYLYGTPELHYTVTSTELMQCAVSGIDESFSGAVYVPKYVTISGHTYSVKAINNLAFERNTKITHVRISDGVEKIGKYAFRSCTSLIGAYMSESVREIGIGAFSHCTSLSEFFLGCGCEKLGLLMLDGCDALKNVHYAGNDDDLDQVTNHSVLGERTVLFNSEDTTVRIELPISDDAISIEKVTVDGITSVYYTNSRDGHIRSVSLIFDSERSISGKCVKVTGTLAQTSSGYSGMHTGFTETEDGKRIDGFSAVCASTLAEAFDGRIFFSGNPSLPNTVFFTERDRTGENNPLYFGSANYFNDGTASYPVSSMLSVRDTLAVFKSADDGCGSIFYHTPLATGDNVVPKAYPVSYTHSGICSLGPAISFFDDPVFLSPLGLCALEHKSVNQERSIGCRSHNINYDLEKEDLTGASMGEWCGYLAIGVNGKIFLADSRQHFIHETNNTEYEWFMAKGIGTYQMDRRCYAYSSVAPSGFAVHPDFDKPCKKTVYTVVNGSKLTYYSPENGVNYCVSPTGEWEGGDFSPASIFCFHDNLMLFGTATGDLCIFNNDMRGVPPDRIRYGIGFDADEYERDMGDKIHPDFYSFVDHAPRYAITTRLDDCSVPYLTKDTVKHSLVVKCKSFGGGYMHLEVGTDKSGYKELTVFSGDELDFSAIDFSNLVFDRDEYYSLPFCEREKGWLEKQITVYSDTYRSPIRISSIGYRYRIRGKIESK